MQCFPLRCVILLKSCAVLTGICSEPLLVGSQMKFSKLSKLSAVVGLIGRVLAYWSPKTKKRGGSGKGEREKEKARTVISMCKFQFVDLSSSFSLST